ncbi:SIS domain-containing protein [Tilletiaria anomala UBC 951]|uniref:SIS domain-containing protein n=1 Tax=Tilletiaria anomala (strain ATCC 24038 / CBS 436.72 / UBC 951) TaxID=1037660 RepID=A0A066VZN9_TILAU|nr:SIS domain-containing protein [Tilletiaria anomala UBC 951]KDN44274.1 SIS domain-containing protein [Tilletiaria anomala UBC 951]
MSKSSSSAASSGFARLALLDDRDSLYGGASSSCVASTSSLETTPQDSPLHSPSCASPDALHPRSATLSFAAEVLAAEARALQAATMRLKTDPDTAAGFDAAINVAIQTISDEGKLIWCGVGKSGLIARKLCASALSLGLSSVFLHPTEALHGDLGIVHSKDVVILLSYSGCSSEITALLPHIFARGTPVVAFCGKPSSQLVQQSRAWVDCRMPLLHHNPTAAAIATGGIIANSTHTDKMEGEAWAEVPAPSSTTTLTLALGDALIFTIARELGKGKRDFALNHPNGALGQAMRDQGLLTCAAAG